MKTAAITGATSLVVSAPDVDRRIIEPSEFVADTEAFIDVRIPGSIGKASYSFIGPGVSQNGGQTISLMVPHGFNVGAASMPNDVVNNPHLHYTAEVFLCTNGSFRFFIGEHGEQHVDVKQGDVFSVPTWVFRGFKNTGPDDGFLFTVLGGDDTGGIIWAPHILDAAAETGLFLGKDYSVIEAENGCVPEGVVDPLDSADLAGVEAYSDSELAQHLVTSDSLNWCDTALLSSMLGQHRSSIAPVIGRGMSQNRRQLGPIMTAHGFSAEWLRIPPGSSVGYHNHHDTQAMFLTEGTWQIAVNRGADRVERTPATGSVVSVPPGSWRNYTNLGETDAVALIVCGGDARTEITWDTDIISRASDAGFAIDANGYVAPNEMLPKTGQLTKIDQPRNSWLSNSKHTNTGENP